MLDPKTPLGRITFVAFDTETTGTGAGTRLLEIAGSRFTDGEFEAKFEALIDPGMPIPPDSTEVHQITDEMVRGKPKAPDVLRDFFEFCEGAALVAHNAPFDAAMIGLELTRHRIPAPQNPIFDTLVAARRMFPAGAHTLDALIDLIGLPRQDARHRAFGDAELVRHLIARMVETMGGAGVPLRSLVEQTGPPEKLENHVLTPPPLPEALRFLADACRDRKKANLHIDGGGQRPQQRIVTPEITYEWNGNAFLEAYVADDGASKTFRLDKIVKAEPGASSGFLF